VTSSSIIPIPPNAVIVDPSTGEGVRVTGTIHVATAVTVDGTGATHTEMHFDVQGVSGVGLISGTHYQGIRTDTLCSNSAESVPSHFTTRIDINLISQGARGDLTIRDALLRVTVNADRTVTVQSVTLA
jgi:hypothetical protein